jgi:hypothetical protein
MGALPDHAIWPHWAWLVLKENLPTPKTTPLAQPEHTDSTACDLVTKQPSPHHHNLPWHEGLARSCHLAPLGQVGAERKPSNRPENHTCPRKTHSAACDLMTKQPSPHHHNLPWHGGLAKSCHLAPLGQVGAERKPSISAISSISPFHCPKFLKMFCYKRFFKHGCSAYLAFHHNLYMPQKFK